MNLYLAPFHSSFSGYGKNACGKAWGPLSEAVEQGEGPYDIPGDDPSLFSHRRYGGSLTWGVCRQQVRNALRPGDVVVFFSFGKSRHDRAVEYRLCAVATVERKVRQTDVWHNPALGRYRRYLNLLIRPARQDNAWEHYEPGAKDAGHRDWLSRIAEHGGLKKRDFERLERSNLLPADARVHGRPLRIAENYVIFSSNPTETMILENPPVIAWNRKNGSRETWESDDFSRAVKDATLGVAHQYGAPGFRTLRSRNLQRAHPPVHWAMPPDEGRQWRAWLLRSLHDLNCCQASDG